MMSIDPVHFVVAPKVLAFVISMPLLSALFIVLGLAGGYLVGVLFLGVDAGRLRLEPAGARSTFVRGRGAEPGQAPGLRRAGGADRRLPRLPRRAPLGGVAAATTSTVVVASVTTLIVDYFLTALMGV